MQLTRINNDKQTGNCPAKIRKLFILILNKIIPRTGKSHFFTSGCFESHLINVTVPVILFFSPEGLVYITEYRNTPGGAGFPSMVPSQPRLMSCV